MLENNGYIIRKGRYLELTRKGVERAGDYRRHDIRSKYVRSVRAMVADVCLSLSDWQFISGREIKRMKRGFNPNMMFSGLFLREDKRYVLYFLNDIPKETTVKKQTEIGVLKYDPEVRANGVLAFCLDKGAMEVLAREDFGVKEFMVLPYPYGVKVVGNYFSTLTRDESSFGPICEAFENMAPEEGQKQKTSRRSFGAAQKFSQKIGR
ncbi:MAG: hypothetical protein AB1652_05890 [Bacillota bacterium]